MLYVKIAVRGWLDPDWTEWFEGLAVTQTEDDTTLLEGPLSDTTALYGLLSRLRDLGLELISLRTAEDQEALSGS